MKRERKITTNKLRLLVLSLAVIMSTGVYAQNRQSSERNQSNKQTQQTQRSGRSNDQKQSQKRGSDNHKTITVTSKPQNTHNQVNRSQVEFKKQQPKAVTMRRPSGNNGMKVMKHDNRNYYYKSGLFYSLFNNEYVKVAAPIGLTVNVLPQGYVSISLNGRNHYYYEGTYYVRTNNQYIVEEPPVGAIVYALPVDYEKVVVDGELLYEYNGILYQRIRYNNERAYQVVGYLN
jgi:hypothetical protein